MRLQENTVAGILNLCKKTGKKMGRITVYLLDHTGDLKKHLLFVIFNTKKSSHV